MDNSGRLYTPEELERISKAAQATDEAADALADFEAALTKISEPEYRKLQTFPRHQRKQVLASARSLELNRRRHQNRRRAR